MSLEDEWMKFCKNENDDSYSDDDSPYQIKNEEIELVECFDETPKPSEIYISTKTKIAYLNKDLDLFDLFWKIQLIQYYEDKEGVIKKQMKFNSLDKESYDKLGLLVEKEKNNNYVEETIIQHVDTQNGDKLRFKDIRKISIGISKKDILSYRSKPKSAFYNCFVVLVRLLCNGSYKETHIKVFNTGKVEIPGIQDDITFNRATEYIKTIISEYMPVEYVKDKVETVLINSNFSCGYLINRDKLFTKQKQKYKNNASFDPCSYPGIQCKYKITQDNINYEISFMIFRTGSILIVGKCNDSVLFSVYDIIKTILYDEYQEIKQAGTLEVNDKQTKKPKTRKKKILITCS